MSRAVGDGGKISMASNPYRAARVQPSASPSWKTKGPCRASGTRQTVIAEYMPPLMRRTSVAQARAGFIRAEWILRCRREAAELRARFLRSLGEADPECEG